MLTIHAANSAFENLGKESSYILQGKVPFQNSPADKAADFAGDMTLPKPGLLLHDRSVEALFIKQTWRLNVPESIKIPTASNVNLSNSQGVPLRYNKPFTLTQHAVVSWH